MEGGNDNFFFGKLTHIFWDTPPIKKGGVSILKEFFDFFGRRKAGTAVEGNDRTRELMLLCPYSGYPGYPSVAMKGGGYPGWAGKVA
jgi:hypothetical protein